MAEFTEEDDALLGELGVEAEAVAKGGRSAREERVVAGFEEIRRFAERHGRAPSHGEGRDVFERLYAVRLDSLRARADLRALLAPLDHGGLLAGDGPVAAAAADDMDDDELLARLGVDAAAAGDVTELRHVRSAAEKRAAQEVANRRTCEDFERFRPLFEEVRRDLRDGVRETRRFTRDAGFLKADIEAGQFFVLGGQTAYVAEVGTPLRAPNGETDARLRVVYSNGTESDLLLRSLQRALYKDEAGRRISEPQAGPLFSDRGEDGDEASGTVYVLRSRSDHPVVAAHRDLLHKVGVTGGDVARRVANARLDPTFLMADVEVVATYGLFNIDRARLEGLIHRVFGPARLDIEVKDRFGNPVSPREWFLVPLFVVDEAVGRIRDGSLAGMVYDPKEARLVRADGA